MLNLLICHEDPSARRWLQSVMRWETDIALAKPAADYETARETMGHHPPDVILISGKCLQEDSLELAQLCAGTSVVLALPEKTPHRVVGDALRQGVYAVLVGSPPPQEVCAAVYAAEARQVFLPPVVVAEHTDAIAKVLGSGLPAPSDAGLTPREFDVLHLLAQGLSNEEIAQKLFVSISTIRSHVLGVMRKIGARNRAQAVYLALTTGLLEDRVA